MEPCRCLGKGRTKPRDQEVQRPRGWNVLDVVGESKSSVAEEERPMGRVLGNESERASGQIMQGFRGPGQDASRIPWTDAHKSLTDVPGA